MSLSAPALVTIDNLKKTFRTGERTTEALRGVTTTIRDGEFVAVMGASGSGKSTLLHLTAGLTAPDSGSIILNGQNLFTLNDAAKTAFRRDHIGIIFQSFNLISTLNVEDNILLPLWADNPRAATNAKPRLNTLLARLGLEHLKNAYPDALSGGEQQRVAIARALLPDPMLILADEPTGSLDSVNGDNVCRLLKQISTDDKKTIILVTHEPAVAVYADRVMILKDGKSVSEFPISDYPTPHSLAAHYQDTVRG